MQTFLPYSCFETSAKVLDQKRLFKQVIEAKQILALLGFDVTKNDGSLYVKRGRHKKHPAVLMWKNYENALINYHNVFLRECLNRNIKTSMSFLEEKNNVILPYWLNIEIFHASHRSNLVRKNPSYYNKFNWKEDVNLEYWWPTKQSSQGE